MLNWKPVMLCAWMGHDTVWTCVNCTSISVVSQTFHIHDRWRDAARIHVMLCSVEDENWTACSTFGHRKTICCFSTHSVCIGACVATYSWSKQCPFDPYSIIIYIWYAYMIYLYIDMRIEFRLFRADQQRRLRATNYTLSPRTHSYLLQFSGISWYAKKCIVKLGLFSVKWLSNGWCTMHALVTTTRSLIYLNGCVRVQVFHVRREYYVES